MIDYSNINQEEPKNVIFFVNQLPFVEASAPGRIRTCDLRIRSPELYPAELQAHINQFNGVSDGTRTRDIWSHIPELYQLSYAHRNFLNLRIAI